MCISRKKSNTESENNKTPQNTIDGGKPNKDTEVNVVFCGVTIIMLLIAAGGIWMFIESCKYETKYAQLEDIWLKQRNSIYSTAIPADSVLTEIIAVRDKLSVKSQISEKGVNEYLVPVSEIAKIKETQKLLLMRQDQLTDDIRQETNNIVNKMNGWLGFWMAVMAILGVFVPIALQIKLYLENRDSDARLRQECHEELEHLREESASYESKCENVLRTEQAKITGELLKMEVHADKQFEQLQNELQNKYQKDKEELQRIKFAAIIRSFHNIADSPEIRTIEVRNELLKKNWTEIVDLVNKFIAHYITQTPGNGESYVMSVVLVQIVSVISTLRILNPHRNRHLESLTSESYKIIENLNSLSPDRNNIIKTLKNYQESLSMLSPLN